MATYWHRMPMRHRESHDGRRRSRLDAVAGELLGDVALQLLGRSDVGVAPPDVWFSRRFATPRPKSALAILGSIFSELS
jgi:hypothetical protein